MNALCTAALVLWAFLASLPALAGPGGVEEAYAAIVQHQHALAAALASREPGRVAVARDALEHCVISGPCAAAPDQARRSKLQIEIVEDVAASAATPEDGDAGRASASNVLPPDALLRLALQASHDGGRLDLLEGVPGAAAAIEREAIAAAAATDAELLIYVARLPVDPTSPILAGLLQGGPLLRVTRDTLVRSDRADPRVERAAARVNGSDDPPTALRLAVGEAFVRRLVDRYGLVPDQTGRGAPTGQLSPEDRDELLDLVHLLGWIVGSELTTPVQRGDALRAAHDLLRLGRALDAVEGEPELAELHRSLLVAAFGDPSACPDSARPGLSSPGADRAALELAARFLFRWNEGDPAASGALHALGGELGELDANDPEIDVALCRIGQRPELIELAVPASLAYAERAFFLNNDKETAFDGARMALRNAGWIRQRGVRPPEAWWVGDFGELVLPYLNPCWCLEEPAKVLARWVRESATDWLRGFGPDPVELVPVVAAMTTEDGCACGGAP